MMFNVFHIMINTFLMRMDVYTSSLLEKRPIKEDHHTGLDKHGVFSNSEQKVQSGKTNFLDLHCLAVFGNANACYSSVL